MRAKSIARAREASTVRKEPLVSMAEKITEMLKKIRHRRMPDMYASVSKERAATSSRSTSERSSFMLASIIFPS
jgi:hypothetical protein